VAIKSALRDAGRRPEQIGYVAAHAPSGIDEDKAEAAAIRQVFGAAAGKLPVTAMKSMLGYAGSASGVTDLVCALVAMRGGFIPPTINYEHRDPACDLNIVAKTAREARVETVLVNSFGLGGQAAALVIKRMD
jgi:3-oxoacyl-[acyl-carrier-protein] synthase II